ncbi:phosphatase PAP2 family protein [Dactylosporangium sp. CS-033363]|uniref:phosphatase PAP2 family protein n=1 Tax=Dactylosporangium sp. CS-033363 TaxID=3239935 RepID=UPI003D8D87A2
MRLELRPVRPAGWWLDALLVAGFVLITVLLAAKTPVLSLDLAVRDFVDAHRPGWADTTLRVFNKLGQGGQILTPLAVIVAFFLTRARRTVRPFLLVIGAFAITYVTIGPLKIWTDRAAASEHTITHPEWLFRIDSGMSYPSGHVVNAIVWYGVLATLLTGVLRPGLVTAIRYTIPLVLLFTTTYLSFHWITDGLAALMLGVFLDRILRRVPWDAIPLPFKNWDGAFYDTQEPARITR